MEEWGLLRLNEIESINTQSIWHASALTREAFDYENVLFIDWPNKPFISVGYHQDPKEELDLSYCESKGYDVYRRSCGGGQVFLDGQQIFYHAITDPNNDKLGGSMKNFYENLLSPVVKTYNEFGVNAKYVPVNDIEADGKKVSGNGAATLGDSKILTGNFILKFPTQEMAKTFKVPDEKFRNKIAQTLEERVGSFHSLTGTIPDTDKLITSYISNFESQMGVKLVETKLPDATKTEMERLNKLYRTDSWKYEINSHASTIRAVKIKGGVFVVNSMLKSPGGLIKGIFVIEDDIITDASISGDITIDPIDGLTALENSLKGVSTDKENLINAISATLSKYDSPGVTDNNFVDLIMTAISSKKE